MAQTKVLIAFYSRTGVTAALAEGVAEGARSAGAEVRLRRTRELVSPQVMASVPGWTEGAAKLNAKYEAPTEADADWADAIVFGSPTRFGVVSSELKAYIDSLGALWFHNKLNYKAGSAFTSTSTPHGGNEATVLSLWNPFAHLGLIVVPVGYGEPAVSRAGSPYGASSVSFNKAAPPTADDLAVARYQGKRVAEVGGALKVLRPESAAA